MRTSIGWLLSWSLMGCAACTVPGGADSGRPDSGVVDAGATDAGTTDGGEDSCTANPDCTSSVSFSTRLDFEPNRLNGLRLTVCHRSTCVTAQPRLTSGISANDLAAECAGGPGLSCVLTRRADGRFTATLALALSRSAAPVDGDVVSFKVVDSSSAAVLYQVTRPVAYEPALPLTACGCKSAAQFVGPASASNALCTTRPCAAGAHLKGSVGLQGDEPLARVCRGDACAIAAIDWDEAKAAGLAAFSAPLAGARVSLVKQGSSYHFELDAPAAPDELPAADRYRLDFGTLSAVDQLVPYLESFPNSQACDAVACRAAAVTVP